MSRFYIDVNPYRESCTAVRYRPFRENIPIRQEMMLDSLSDYWLIYGSSSTGFDGSISRVGLIARSVIVIETRDINFVVERIIRIRQIITETRHSFECTGTIDFDYPVFDCSLDHMRNDITMTKVVSELQDLADRYFEQFLLFSELHDDFGGNITGLNVDLNPSDDLVREYKFRDGKRTLVVPNIGNYQRIRLPVIFSQCDCQGCIVNELYHSVYELNAIVSGINWICMTIAERLPNYKATTLVNGPYWAESFESSSSPVLE